MTPRKLPSGRWNFTWQHSGIRRSATFATREEAESAIKQILDVMATRKSIALATAANAAVSGMIATATTAAGTPLPLPADSPFMTRKEVADYLRVPLNTITSWVFREEIPFVRLTSKTVRFVKTDIVAWANRGLVNNDRAPASFGDLVESALEKRIVNLTEFRLNRLVGAVRRRTPRFGISDARAEIAKRMSERIAARAYEKP